MEQTVVHVDKNVSLFIYILYIYYYYRLRGFNPQPYKPYYIYVDRDCTGSGQ